MPTRRGYDRILVRGIEGEAEISDVAGLRKAREVQRTDEGWLVAVRRISQAARDEVNKMENRNLVCYTFDELIDESADFSGYFNWLETEVKRRGIDQMYVPLACTKEEFDPLTKEKIGESRYDERNGWLDGYIDRWLDDPSKEHISILGEFGTGKTWFVLRYAWIALQRYRRAKMQGVERPRLPLVIPLRDYAKAVNSESLFSDFFFRRHEIPLPGYSAFEQLNRIGKLLLMFDGFDEMAAKVDRQKMIDNFWELARIVVPGAKVILTCRTEHFPEAKEGRALLSAELQASTAKLTGESPQFEMLELEKFNDAQIRQVLSFRAGLTTVERVMSNPQLLDLARRPVMADFILEALPAIEAGKPVDMSRIYLYAVKRKMERDIKEERTFTSLADKLYFLCEVSWEMLSSDRMSLNYRRFPARLRRLFGRTVQEEKDLDHWQFDMLGQTMLVRNADGDYTPAHRSLLEFFVAYKFAAELGILADDFTELARAQSHLEADAEPKDYVWSEYFRRDVDKTGAIKPITRLQGFVAEEINVLAKTVGLAPLTGAILDLMSNMPGPDEEAIKDRLLTIIERTRGKAKEVGVTGGNACTLLIRHDPLALRGRNLSTANLNYTDFGKADLTSCNLHGANLQRAQFRGTVLENADLREADLTDAQFVDMGVVMSVVFNADGTMLASGGEDTSVYIWDVATGSGLFALRGHSGGVNSISWRHDGNQLASGSDDGSVMVWELEASRRNWALKKHAARVTTVCFSPKGQGLASGSADGNVIVWAIPDYNAAQQKKFSGHVYGVRYSPDGRLIANRSRRATVVVWHADTGETTSVLEGGRYGDAITHIDFHPNGAYLALTVGNRFFRIWDIESRDIVQDIGEHSARVTDMRYSPDGSYIASSSIDMTIHIYASSDGRLLGILKGHLETVNAISYAPDGNILASGSNDATIKFWDVRPFVTGGGTPHINIVEHTPPDLSLITDNPATWPEWWQKCKIDVPDGMLPNPDFGKCLRTIDHRLNCKGLQLAGAKGLDATLAEWLKERGAIFRNTMVREGEVDLILKSRKMTTLPKTPETGQTQ